MPDDGIVTTHVKLGNPCSALVVGLSFEEKTMLNERRGNLGCPVRRLVRLQWAPNKAADFLP